MIRLSLIITLLFAFVECALADNSFSVVDTYYMSIQQLSGADPNEAFDLQNKIMLCFSGKTLNDRQTGFSGINIYNEFIGSDSIPSNLYAQRLMTAINKKKELKLNYYHKLDSAIFMQPQLNKKEENYQLGQTKVTLEYVYKARPLSKTEFIGVVNNQIVRISDSEIGIDAMSLTIKAAEFYTNKKYKDAFLAYQQVIKIEPNNVNALYRLGIMTAKGQGTKRNISVAKSYFEKIIGLTWRDDNGSWYNMYNLYYFN